MVKRRTQTRTICVASSKNQHRQAPRRKQKKPQMYNQRIEFLQVSNNFTTRERNTNAWMPFLWITQNLLIWVPRGRRSDMAPAAWAPVALYTRRILRSRALKWLTIAIQPKICLFRGRPLLCVAEAPMSLWRPSTKSLSRQAIKNKWKRPR